MTWRISIISRDGRRMIFHAQCADEKECQALATEARHRSLGLQIWIKPPMGGKLYSWD